MSYGWGKTFFLYWLPALAWMGIIFRLSSVPGSSLPPMPSDFFDILAHKSVHFAEYTTLGFLFLRALRHSSPEQEITKLIFISVIAIFLFGASDEWHQSLVPGRYAKFADVVFDTIYAVLGMLVFSKMFDAGKKKSKNPLDTSRG